MENLRDSQQDTSPGSKGTHQITGDRKRPNAGSTEGGGGGDDALQLLVHALVSVASHDKSLVLELLRDIPWARSGNLNPGLGEDRTRDKHIQDIDSCVERVEESIGEVQWRRHVVGNAGDSVELGRPFLWFPNSKQLDKEIVGEAGVEHLADQEDVGRERRLKHDGHVGGVEEADGVRSARTTLAGRLNGDFDSEALEVDNGSKDNESRQQVHDVGQVLSVESLLESALLVGPGEQ